MIVKLAVSMLILFVLPLLLGVTWNKTPAKALVMGVAMMMTLFQIIAVPAILLKISFYTMCYIYWGILLICSIGSIVFLVMKRKQGRPLFQCKLNGSKSIVFWIALAMVILQCVFVVVNNNQNADDARYVASALEAVESGTMLINHPATGSEIGGWTCEIEKDVTSPWCIYYAAIAWACRLHPAIIIHTCVPLLWLILHYLVCIMLVKDVLKLQDKQCAVFVILLSILNTIGISSHSVNSFVLLRNWQGKSIVVAVVIPVLVWFYGSLFESTKMSLTEWVESALIATMSCLSSGMGIFLVPIFVGCVILTMMLQKRSLRPMFLLAGCIPNFIYGVIYILIK